MLYAVNKLVAYMTVYVLEIELVSSFFSALTLLFLHFFYLRLVGYIVSYKLNF